MNTQLKHDEVPSRSSSPAPINAASSGTSAGTKLPSPAQAWHQDTRARKVAVIVALVVIAGAVIWYFAFYPYVSTDDARVATTLVHLAPEDVTGKIIKLNVEEGDVVKKDQVVIELDHRRAEANLIKAKARVTQTSRDLKRMEQLAAQNGVPPREVDTAGAMASTAAADLQLAELAFDHTYIRSPMDGIVVQKTTELGNILEADQTALTISDRDHAWIAANIEETAVGTVRVGQPVTITVDEGGKLNGKVSEVRDATAAQFALIQAENPSGNFTKLVQRIPIKIVLDDHPGMVLRAGQSVEIRIRVH